MPQMAPLMWVYLMLMFLFVFMVFITFSYYTCTILEVSEESVHGGMVESKAWKW